jgi:hypothetical protein
LADTINTIVPWILLIIGIVWLWSIFGGAFMRFFAWIRSFFASSKDKVQDRFQRRSVGGLTEFTYN